MIYLALLIAVYIGYMLIAAYLSRGIRNDLGSRKDMPPVSVVIPARNEEQCLPDLLDSLLQVDYPMDRLQIIIINDQSTDRTREVAQSYQEKFQCRYDVHDVVDEPDGKLVLKTRPLAQGLDRATGEVILMTDADCIVTPSWIRTVASYFTPGVGMVCGTTLPHPQQHSRFPLTAFETLDWLFLL
ncbi:glycosyltransferase, partial [candidate division KSB1 bacterium]